MIWLGVILTGLIIFYNFVMTNDEDPNANKKIGADGRLVATKDFYAKGGRFIQKGTKGGQIHPKAKLDMTDMTWVENDCMIGEGSDIYNSYLRGCNIENWHICDSEVMDCELKAIYPIEWLVEDKIIDKVWDVETGTLKDK